jgi:tetratricopeptide (TPR) repeat protein
MATKKEQTQQLSPAELSQVQHLFTQYRQFAERLHASTDQGTALAALAEITRQPELIQLALLKELAKERQSEAADILAALHALSPLKELRKEARRGLLRQEAAKIRPRWQAPAEQTPITLTQADHAPRFWKGLATETREQGEMQLYLAWEQAHDYGEVRLFTFVLDFWHEGIKEATLDLLTKRQAEERINTWRNRVTTPETQVVDCTLAEGKRLLEDALSVNEHLGKQAADSYRNLSPLVNTFILQAQNLGEDRGRSFMASDMEPDEIVLNFVGAWSFGDFGLAYDLLSGDSELRDDLDRANWITRHRAWHKEAHPLRLELSSVHEREIPQSVLWLPSTTNRAVTRREIEIGWSLELTSTPLSGTLKEMPLGTAVNKETGRHWFATTYTLVRETSGWRIQRVKDEGSAVQGLPIEELQTRIKEHETSIEKQVQQRENMAPQQFVEEMSWRLAQLLYLYDALIIQLPLDYTILNEASTYAILAGNAERTLVYLERIVQRFQDQKLDNLRRLSATLIGLAHSYDETSMQERVQHLFERAEATLRELISLEDSALNHALLGEFLLSRFRHDEAEVEFQRALELHPDPDHQTSIEAGLGNIAMRRDQLNEGIAHYRRVVELNPQYPAIWFSLGFAHRMLGQFAEAERCYQQAIQNDPQDPRAYTDLAAIYLNTERKPEARATLERAIQINPESAHLRAIFASLLFELGEQRAAQRTLAEAERLDPEDQTVLQVRQHIHGAKS